MNATTENCAELSLGFCPAPGEHNTTRSPASRSNDGCIRFPVLIQIDYSTVQYNTIQYRLGQVALHLEQGRAGALSHIQVTVIL